MCCEHPLNFNFKVDLLGRNALPITAILTNVLSCPGYIGHVLDVSKCDVIPKSNALNIPRSGPLKDFIALTFEDITILGAELSRSSALNSGSSDKIDKPRTAFGRIWLLPAQEALIILR